MNLMPTESLSLRRDSRGYYVTSWIDADGKPHTKSFKRDRATAQIQFNHFHARWQADPVVRTPSGEGNITIQQLWDRFWAHAQIEYRRADGTPTGEAENFFYAVRELLELFGDQPARDFGPKSLMLVRERMIATKRDDEETALCLNTINNRIRRIRHIFKWGAKHEMVPAETWHSLQTVDGLRRNRAGVRSTDKVPPVPEPYIWQVVSLACRAIAAMIQLEYLSGFRPGEVCTLRPIEIKVKDKVWLYEPYHHKTRHHDKDKVVILGPKAQQILQPFMDRDLMAYCFSPLEMTQERYKACQHHRKAPVAAPATSRRIGDHYTVVTYRQAIEDICTKHGIPHWTPNQLRHNCYTRMRDEYGLDVAQVVAGHSSANTTEIYAQANVGKAIAAMERAG